MKGFFPLLKLSFKTLLLTTMNIGTNKKKAASGLVAFAAISLLMLFMSVSYSMGMAFAFSMLGALDIMLRIMTLMALVFPFIFVVFAAQGSVFSTKDVDFVLSLPVSSFAVMLARVLALYLEALLLCALMLLPSGIIYVIFGGTGGVMVPIILFFECFFLALIPTTVALTIGALVSLTIGRARHKNLIGTILNVVFFVLAMLLAFGGSFGMSSMMDSIDAFTIDIIRAGINSILPLTGWAVQGMLGSSSHILLVVAIGIIPFIFITWLFSRLYKSILTHLASQHLKNNYKLRSVSASGSFAALFNKESRRFFTTPAYLLNSGVGYVMLLISAVAAVVKRSALQSFIERLASDIGFPLNALWLPLALLGIIVFMCGVSTISSVSISLEGKTLWILKEAPLSIGKIFCVKAGFGSLLATITTIFSATAATYAFSLPFYYAFIIIAVGSLFSLLCNMTGLYINLRLPRMDADNDTLVVKNSSSVLVSMLANVLLLALLAGAIILLSLSGLGFVGIGLMATALLAALCAGMAALLNTSGRRLFAQL